MTNIKEVQYIRKIMSSKDLNMQDIIVKCNRGVGISNKIQNMLTKKYFGKYYFEVGLTLIESVLLGSIITNIGVAYNITTFRKIA